MTRLDHLNKLRNERSLGWLLDLIYSVIDWMVMPMSIGRRMIKFGENTISLWIKLLTFKWLSKYRKQNSVQIWIDHLGPQEWDQVKLQMYVLLENGSYVEIIWGENTEWEDKATKKVLFKNVFSKINIIPQWYNSI